MKYNLKYLVWLFYPTMLVLLSCDKEVEPSLPGEVGSAAMNIYIASEVMHTVYTPTRGGTAVYIDTILNNGNNPIFRFGYGSSVEYPLVSYESGINLFGYSRYNAGNHRLLFTGMGTIVKDTVLSLEHNSWNTLYFADAPASNNAEAAYTVLQVSEPRQAREGLTGVRFVHLSPDAGNLECRALLADGTPSTDLLATIGFGDASQYTYLSQENAANGLLRLQIGNSDIIDITTGVPALPGRSFVVVIRGFVNGATRITTGRDTNGNEVKETVSVEPGLQLDLRTSY